MLRYLVSIATLCGWAGWVGTTARAPKEVPPVSGPPFHRHKPPLGCKTIGQKCNAPYPGNLWQHPKIHQSPDCLHVQG